MKAGPAKKLNKKYADHRSGAVKTYVPDTGGAAGNKGLMVFVQSGKAHAYNSGKKKQPESPYLIYIKGEGDSNGKKKIFCHMSSLTDIIMNLIRFIGKLVITFSCIQKFVLCLYDLIADLITEFPGHLPSLG